MTATVVTDLPHSWDEPEGVAPRGTLILLTGRGETAATYARFGRRISADAYKVRVAEVDLGDLAAARTAVSELVADEALPAPKVLVGSDTGATLAALLVGELPVDAAVIAGLALPGASGDVDAAWEDELEVRSACPTYRGTISADTDFARGALAGTLPWDEVSLSVPGVPLLVVHGREDRVTPVGDALKPWVGAGTVEQHVVEGGRHDILNDVTHRSVAATVVLFLERLKLGADLPVIVRQVGR
ncbi:alpha/beta hydrolase [Nocardioides sp. NBC_00850]|uniref:alpha/beta hydrolase n=1 Tax=Nocardioides sp. NBC_00850 TaxID=2976001 RepID=UPI003865065A|nr:alpha/beta hydrolase [Nocardioides sp. NBC_00850]